MVTPYFERPLLFFDQERFRKNLAQGNPLPVFKDAIAAANTHFDIRFRENDDIRALVCDRATFIDCLLHYAWHQFTWDTDAALLAVGGYGRGELHPYSDIDILVLFERDNIQDYSDNVESFLMLLWDIGLDIGHSVRTLHECAELAAGDITIATNMMECRTVVGAPHLSGLLRQETGPGKIWPAADFFEAKLEEQQSRHRKNNNTEYNLEPNVKSAPGGLRDIQTISWVAKRYFGVRTLSQLEGKGFFTEREYAILKSGEEFLWKVRYGLHMLAGRAEDRLLFDHQRELAKFFGYSDSEKRLAVEQFMQWYYRVVLSLRELNDVLLQFLSEAILQKGKAHSVVPINERFQLRNDFIEVTQIKVFEETPSALLEIFVLMGNTPSIKGVRASTIRLIRESRHLIDDDFRNDPQNHAQFLSLFSVKFGLVTQLKRMKRYGVLGRYLPEFGRITGQMQHDLFHIYTVDAHTLLVIANMRKFKYPEAEEKFPVAFHIMKRLPKPELLYIAGLYHDIGKGRGGDHSELGAEDARHFASQHGLSRRDTNLIVWLVDNHLLMSYVSQKQDLSDPDVIRNFAITIGDQNRLDYLYALTVADMNGTNPDIWNSWRASLLRQLYLETKRALRRGLENPIDRQDLIDETQQSAIAKLADKGFSEERVRRIWGDVGEDYFLRESHLDIAWQTEAVAGIPPDELVIAISDTSSQALEGATQIFIRTRDRDNVFAAVATTLDQLNLNIQDARIYSSESGFTVDTFYVLDENDQAFGTDDARVLTVKEALQTELSLLDEYSEVIRRRTPRALKSFRIPTRTMLTNDLVSGHTVLEVISPDRPGLLATIGRIFLEFDVHLANARISTLGERVEDVFFIGNSDGTPLSDPELCEQLQSAIRRSLDEQIKAKDTQTLV
ncbi:[protein-PII] uridylyltransferase [Marinibactrum halimedae]|uniref:Bifunctional uridylyltransferase/uridylyl-removing enzyme n=1 Tax=Marinibactrum halimedae TaxID=1444977 RepID=A0AA37T6Y4_9GAMM|nr:[protein-PII] uridylyltransferase [Marinibactrum halimedae]MCD9457569.1 [protein-PII] uridylyltransferase [Marinibactrum halimedae]GLS27989.1 bifunctional uridylyltransferase/uridylyl-removing enzyme [Marinibactrum halimedae]